MTIGQLDLYNGALRVLGERKLASLTEAREPQRVLTDIWNEGKGSTRAMLEKGLWNFACRSQQLTYSPSVSPPFGYQFAFNKTTDWVRTAQVCSDPYYADPLTQYDDEAGFLFCNLSSIYVKFISDDAAYGNNYSRWPQAFIEYYEYYLAWRACFRITQSKGKQDDIEKDMERMGIKARNLDAMDEPAKFFPQGSWSAARQGRTGARNRENNNSSVW